jgi:hypothetical protein
VRLTQDLKAFVRLVSPTFPKDKHLTNLSLLLVVLAAVP